MEGINANTVQNYSQKFIDMAIRYGPRITFNYSRTNCGIMDCKAIS